MRKIGVRRGESENSPYTRYIRSKKGVITSIYRKQRETSRKRGMPPPSYSKKDFESWVKNHPSFDKLFKNWVSRGFETLVKPSVDRLDCTKGYTLSNIRLVTWEENMKAFHRDMRKGIKSPLSNSPRAVTQFSLSGVKIRDYISLSEAAEVNNISVTSISDCCRGVRGKSCGFKWEYKDG